MRQQKQVEWLKKLPAEPMLAYRWSMGSLWYSKRCISSVTLGARLSKILEFFMDVSDGFLDVVSPIGIIMAGLEVGKVPSAGNDLSLRILVAFVPVRGSDIDATVPFCPEFTWSIQVAEFLESITTITFVFREKNIRLPCCYQLVGAPLGMCCIPFRWRTQSSITVEATR